MGKERTKGKGLEGGHTLQAKEMTRLVAPFRARYYCPDAPQATQTSGLCTLGFKKVKAAGLVVVFDHIGPHLLSGEPGSTFDDIINHGIGRGGCHNSFVANF